MKRWTSISIKHFNKVKPRKLHIIYHLLRFRWSRVFHSSRVGTLTRLSWLHNLKKSPFYGNILNKGLQFPVIDKSFFMAKFNEINTVGILKEEAFKIAMDAEKSRDFKSTIGDISVGLSSGTSGNRGLFLTSKSEQEKWVAAILDRVIGISLHKRKVAFFLRANNNLYEAVKSKLIQFEFYDLQKPLDELIPTFIGSKPNILVAQPSVLVEIARYCERNKSSMHLDKIISVAEVLEDDVKVYLSSIFKKPIHQVYQCTEGFLGYTCKDGSLHLNEDFLKIERNYLDKEETKFHPVITDYLRHTQPVVMYELNDILHLGKQCTCGSSATVIKKIEGRSDDIFKFQNGDSVTIIFPDFVRRAIISADETILNYIVSQKSNTEVSLSLEHGTKTQAKKATEALRQLFAQRDLVNIDITILPFEHNPISKFKRIRNDSNTKL